MIDPGDSLQFHPPHSPSEEASTLESFVSEADDEQRSDSIYEVGLNYDRPPRRATEPVGRTLFYFTSDNRFRRKLYSILISRKIIGLEIGLTVLEIIILGIEGSSQIDVPSSGVPVVFSMGTSNVILAIFCVLSLLAVLKCIAFGVLTNRALSRRELIDVLQKGFLHVARAVVSTREKPSSAADVDKRTMAFDRVFLRSSWGRVEALSIIFYWSSAFALAGSSQSLIVIVSGLGHLRILRMLDYVPFTRVVLGSFKLAMPLLANVLLFIGFFLLIWGIIGLQTFNGSLRRVCVYDEIVTTQQCGSYLEPGTLKKLPFLYLDATEGSLLEQSVVKGYTCPVGSKCVEFRAKPSFGSYEEFAVINFDNIFNAFEIVFIIMSNNSFTPIMYDIVDAEHLVSCLFFITGVLILAIWLMNLLVAVMVSCYSRVSDILKSTDEFTLPIVHSLRKLHRNWDLEEQRIGEDRDDNESTPRKGWMSRSYAYFYPLVTLFTLVDLIVQACLTAPNTSLLTWESFLAVIFFVDIFWRFFAFLPYWRTFLMSFMNIIDLILAIANIVVLIFYNDTIVYAWLTIFQLVRVYRIIGTFKFIREFWKQLYGNFTVLANLTVFFFMTTFLCTLVASKMLRGQFPVEDDGSINVFSFYGLTSAYFTMYQVASTENWTDALFWCLENVIRPGQNVVVLACIGILFCGWLFFANFLIFNLFIGVMSDNLLTNVVNKREEQVKELAREVLKRQGASSGILNDYTGEDEEDEDHDMGIRLHQILAMLLRRIKTKNVKKTSPMTTNMRIAIERQFVTEFLESKGQSEDTESVESDGSDGGSIDASDESPSDESPSRHNERGVPVKPLDTGASGSQGVRTPEMANYYVDNSGSFTPSFRGEETNRSDSHGHRNVSAPSQVRIRDFWGHPLVKRVRPALMWVCRIFYHYPENYRRFLHERLESRRQYAKANSNSAYVDEMFDYNQQLLAVLSEYCEEHPSFDKALCIFRSTNGVRLFFQRVFPSSYGVRVSGVYPKRWVGFYVRLFFVALTIALIVQTCINTPLYSLNERNLHPGIKWTWLHTIDLIFGTLFTFEFVGKVIADGFHYTPNAYTCSFWNILDLIVLISIWVTFTSDVYGGSLSRYLRAWMALRALRLISLHRKSERLFYSVFVYGLRNFAAVGLIAMSIVVPYSVWGKNIFHGRLTQCNDGNVNTLDQCVGEYVQTVYNDFPILAPRAVQEAEYFNYNNFWSSLLIQFGVLSLEGWVDVLNAVTSIAGANQQPQTFASTINAIYPIVYDYLRALLIISMFVAVIIRNYAITLGTAFLTEQQLAWRDLRRTLKLVRPTPRPPQYKRGSFRYALLRAIPSWIATVEMWALMLFTATMLAYYYPLSEVASQAYSLIQLGCTIVLICMFVIRLLIMRPRLFFHSWWNPFGLAVCVSIFGLILSMTISPRHTSLGFRNAGRALYVCLLVLWIPRIKRLYQFYMIGTMAISEISKLLYAWMTLYVAFAIALNQSFGLAKLGTQSTWTRNFRTVPKAMIVLFTMSCGEGWNQLLIDYTMSKPYCIENSLDNECGISGFAYILFIAWNVVSMYVFANLFISLICEACWYIYRSAPINVSENDIRLFQESWQHFDPYASGYLDSEDIFRFLGHTRGYFSMSIYHGDPKYSVHKILSITQAGELPSDDPYKVNFARILDYLADMPVEYFKEKATVYTYFATHARLCGETHPSGKLGVPFNKLLKLFPLYKDMDPAESLTIKEFIALNVELHEVKVKLAVDFISVRWLKNRRQSPDPHY